MPEKKCTKCGETKPLDAFHRHKSSRFGRCSTCRDCRCKTLFRCGLSAEERFKSKVLPGATQPHMDTPCLMWTGGKTRDGYGSFRYDGTSCLAHRVSFRMFHGREADRDVLHHCDVPECVNPHHLYEGTQADNARDRERRGRGRDSRGVLSGTAKLNPDAVVEMRALRAAGESLDMLAERFGVGRTTVDCACRRKTWKHVQPTRIEAAVLALEAAAESRRA